MHILTPVRKTNMEHLALAKSGRTLTIYGITAILILYNVARLSCIATGKAWDILTAAPLPIDRGGA